MVYELAPAHVLSSRPGRVAHGDERAVLETLAEVAASFTAERQLEPVLDRLLGAALQLIGADTGSILLLSRERDALIVVAARGPGARSLLGTRQPADGSLLGWALRASEVEATDAAVTLPLAICGRLVGVLNAIREPATSPVDEFGARLLELLAHAAAIVIDSAQMVDELQRKDQRLEQLVDQLLSESGRRPDASLDLLAPLTRREQQVLELLVDGLTNREIGLRLVVEPDTVKDHVQSIIKKLGATDRTHAAVIAVRGGIVS